jgi:pimeloyl-ACP methyl ester carboxylesterase
MKTKIFISLLLLVMLSSCGQTAEPQTAQPQNQVIEQETTEQDYPGYIPVFEPGVCPFALPQGKLEGQDVECGTLIVPEDRKNPETGEVHLAVAVFKNPGSENYQVDPIVFIEGGPGVEVLSKISYVFEQFVPLMGDRDMIFFDPRGVGFSSPSLDCPESLEVLNNSLEQDISPDQAQQLGREALLACGKRLDQEGVNLSAYNVVENAADLNDLRIVLGYDEWNLFSVSYGTRVVQELLRNSPQGVRSVVLDSAVSLEADVFEEVPANIDQALGRLFTTCEADPQCQAAYPALENQLFALVEDLNAAPIKSPVANLISGERFDAVQADGSTLLNVVFTGLYSDDVIPYLPKLISDTAKGDYNFLSSLRSNMLTNQLFISEGAYHASLCRDEIPFNSNEEIDLEISQYPRLADFLTGPAGKVPFDQLCEDWGITAANPEVNQPVSTELPVLILAGQFDPASPVSWGAQVSKNMSASTFLEFPNIGHSVTLSHSCPLSITITFINDPTETLDTACMREISLEIVTPVGVAELNLIPVEVLEFGIQALAPDTWIAAKPDYYISPDQSYELVFTKEQESPLESFLAAWGVEEPGTEFSTDTFDWMIYVVKQPDIGKIIFIAVSPTEGGFYLTLVVGPGNQAEGIQNYLFMPILQSFSVSE